MSAQSLSWRAGSCSALSHTGFLASARPLDLAPVARSMLLTLPDLHGQSLRDTLPAVRKVRIWLLVLLSVLLPIQGAVAAGMLCPNESTPVHEHQHSHNSMSTHHQVMVHEHGMQAVEHVSTSHAHHDHGGAGHQDRCNLCASCCAGAAITTTFATVFAPLEAATESFAPPASPVASFLSGGQERPPRSI